ncbi:MAG: murein biosynthesis integral membrane protein MurJ [Planctomycetota bacterium]
MAETGTAAAGRDIGDRIIRGGMAVGVASIIMKFTSLIWRQSVSAKYGTTHVADDYFFAFGLVIMIFNIAQQTVAPAFLPVFLAQKRKEGEGAAWRFASSVLAIVIAAAGLLSVLAFVYPGVMVSFSAWLGGKTVSPEEAGRLGLQVSYAAPAFVGVAVSVVTYMTLTGYKRFFWAQSGETSMRLVMIVSVLGAGYLGLTGGGAVRVLGLGIVAGALARLGTHLLALGKRLGRVRAPFGATARPALGRFGLLMLPLFLGSLVSQLRDFVNNYGVLRFAGEGLVSASSYGRGIYTTMEWLVPLSLGIAMFPYFCDLVDRNDLKALGDILTRSGRVLMLAFFAFSGAVAVMGAPFTYLLFGVWKKMDAGGLELVSIATACYVTVLPALALEKLVMQGFYSNRRMIAPTVLGMVFSFLSVGVSMLGIRFLGLEGATALAVVALGFVASRYLKTLALVLVLRRRVPMFPAGETLLFLLKAIAVAAAAGGSATLVRIAYESRWPLVAAAEVGALRTVTRVVPETAIAGTVSIAAALAAIRLLRMEELGWIVEWFRKKRSSPDAGASSGGQEGADS